MENKTKQKLILGVDLRGIEEEPIVSLRDVKFIFTFHLQYSREKPNWIYGKDSFVLWSLQ